MKKEKNISQITLEKNYEKAEEMLKDEDKIEEFLNRLESKLKVIPIAGDKLAYAPILASLLRSYVKKEYDKVPLGSIIAILASLIYLVSPLDAIFDTIPILGYIDDAVILGTCWNLVTNDIEEYLVWKRDKEQTLNGDNFEN